MFGAVPAKPSLYPAAPPPKPPIRAVSVLAPPGYQPPLPPGTPVATPESHTTLYIGIGVGAVLLTAAGYFLLRD